MQTMRRIILAVALAFGFAAMPASAQDDSSLEDTAEAVAQLLRVHEILSAVENSILLTDQDCGDLGEGWTNFEPLGGRFVLAAGRGRNDNQVEEEFGRHDHGGTYKHLLTLAEMPSHTHSYRDRYLNNSASENASRGDDDDRERRYSNDDRTTGSRGNNMPHNNMPPYLVLNFCHRP